MEELVKQLEEQVHFLVELLDERQLEEYICFLNTHKDDDKDNKQIKRQSYCDLPRCITIRSCKIRP